MDETLIERAYFYDEFLLGDVNGDDVVNVLDIVRLVNIILSEGEFNPVGDMNNDGVNNILDLVILAGLILS